VNLFLGTFDGVLTVMQSQLSVDRVVSQRGRLRNLRLRSDLKSRGVAWDELASREEFDRWLSGIGEVELCVVAGFSFILPQAFIDRCRDVVNFHPGIIQQCRGPQPVAAAILRGHRRFGVTLHRIDSEAIDAGPILGQRLLDIDYARSYAENYTRIKALMSELAIEMLPLYTSLPWPAGEPWCADDAAYFPRASQEQVAALARAPTLAEWRRD
jgi:methionyl-tRNA formyltransferase